MSESSAASESAAAPATLRSLRGRIDALEKERDARAEGPGLGSLGVSLGVAVVLLTAMSWAAPPDDATTSTTSTTSTLWDLTEGSGWHGTVTVLAIMLLGVCSVAVSMKARPGRGALRVLVGLSAAAVALVIAAGGIMPTSHTALGDQVDHTSGPARWLTLVAAVALLLTHAVRLGRLRELD